MNYGDFNLAAAYDEVLRNSTMAAGSGPAPAAAMAKVMFFETYSKESRDVIKAATGEFEEFDRLMSELEWDCSADISNERTQGRSSLLTSTCDKERPSGNIPVAQNPGRAINARKFAGD